MSGNQYMWILSGISFLLTFGALTGNLVHNIALHRKATQSSENSQVGAAGNAVDGKRDASFQSGSCMHTEEESDPWWRVDLENVHKIAAVMVTNRDEQENMLDGAEIWIGKSTETKDIKDRCAFISHIPKGRTFYFYCRHAEGRYVTVLLRGSKKVLSLCEVEVFVANYERPLPNVALQGEATQSSTLSVAAASKAIDGRRNSYYNDFFCSHTAEGETDPWWRLDLRRTFLIVSVKVTNRGDCCAERLDGAEIRVGNSLQNNGNNNPRCATISHIQAGKTSTYKCDAGNMEGRFVNVIIPGKSRTLTLCEVEVYAVPAVEPLPNVALNKPTVQATTNGGHGSASHGVSGCSSGAYGEGCCTHTLKMRDPWWRVDLLAVHKVGAVTIFNRADCCPERLVGAQILIGNSLEHDGMKNPRCGVISSLEGKRTFTFQCNFMEGRYVTVMIPGDNQILTLCEVEVYAFPAVPEAETPPATSPPPPPPPPTVSSLLGGRNVTVVGKRLCWSDALFYCRRYHWDLLSLHSQQEQSEVEKLLGRVSFPLTGYVWLGLHRYVMGKNWYWMSEGSMDFTKWPPGFVPHPLSSSCGGMASGQSFLWDDLPCQELLNFICQSGAEDGAQRVYYYSTRTSSSP